MAFAEIYDGKKGVIIEVPLKVSQANINCPLGRTIGLSHLKFALYSPLQGELVSSTTVQFPSIDNELPEKLHWLSRVCHIWSDILSLHKYFVVRTSSTWLNWIGVKYVLVNVVVWTHLGLVSVTGCLFQVAAYIGRIIITQRTEDAWLLSKSEIFKMYEQLRVSPIKLLVSNSWNILLPKHHLLEGLQFILMGMWE